MDEAVVLARSPDPAATYLDGVMPEELRMDLAHMREATFFADLRVPLATMGAVLRQGGS